MKKRFLGLVFLIVLNCSFGQLITNPAMSPNALVQNVLLGPGVTASNIQYTGAKNSIGYFTAKNTNLGIDSGIVFTTGTILSNGNGPQGPNNKAGSGVDNGTGGFGLLDAIVNNGYKTLNAAYLQLDFVPQSDTVRFRYVFGSEEYPEYAPPNNSDFNDIFGFFISGPGISGQQNIATLPNGSFVSINNVNAVTNNNYFIDNGDGKTSPYNSSNQYIQYDGFTKVLTAVAKVECGKKYHLILAIADVKDGVWDSGIFLEANSLKANVDTKITNSVNYNPYGDPKLLAEGCVTNTVTIFRGGNNLPAVTIPIDVAGTATPGVDYSPPLPSSVSFLQGERQKTISFSALGDNIHEGLESILLTFHIQDACGNPSVVDFEYNIKDADSLYVTVNSGNPVCPGDKIEVRADVTGGVGPFLYKWNTGETTQTINVTPSSSTTYSVDIMDDCLHLPAHDDGTVIIVPPAPIVINPSQDVFEICPFTPTSLSTNVEGGVGPYRYNWTSSPSSILDTNSIQNVSPGETTIYTIKVTDHCGKIETAAIKYTVLSPKLTLQMTPNIEVCPGDSVLVWVKPSGGHPVPDWKYFYSWNGLQIKDSSFWVNPMKTTTYNVNVSDSCQTFFVPGSVTITVVKPNANFDIISKPLFNNLLVAFENLTENGDHYTWDLGNGVNSTLVHPTNTYDSAGTYLVHLIAYDKKGCIDSITKPISIEEEYYVYVPNTFTPDGGRLNETFRASTIGISELEIIICNRWGEIVFQSKDQYFRWDGLYNGKPAQDGIYAYKIKCVTNSNRTLNFVGHVGIIR